MSNEITVNLSQTNPVTSVTVDGDTASSIEIPQVAEIDVSAAAALQASLPSLAVSAGTNITVDSSTGVFVISATVPEDLEDLSNVSGTPTVGQALVWSGTEWQPEDQDTGGSSNVDELNDLSDVSGIPSTGQILVYSGTEWNPGDVVTSIADLTDVNGTPTVGQILAWSGTEWQPVDAADTNQLVTASGDLVLDPATGGVVVQGGTDGSGSITLNCEQNSHGLELKAPTHSAFSGNLSFTLPSSTGNQGQVLSTDGNGLMSWIDSSSQIEWVTAPLTSEQAGSAGQIAYDTAGFFYVHDGTLWRRTQLSSFGIAAPEITISNITPADLDAVSGSAASFYVSASVTQGLTLSYQWQLSSDSGVTFVDISGETGSTLTITPSISDNGNSYRCKVSAEGATDKLSRAALLTVSTSAHLLTENGDELQAENGDYILHDGATAGTGTDSGGDTNENKSVTITQQPQDINGYAFEEWPKNIAFSVSAVATGGEISYQWQYGYENGDNDEWVDISGATDSTLNYSMSLSGSYQGYDFRCVISVGGIRGAVSDPATFRRVAEYIMGQPDVRSSGFADTYFNFSDTYAQSGTFGSIIRGYLEIQATKIDANTGQRDYDWDSTTPDRVTETTITPNTYVEMYEEDGILDSGTDVDVFNDSGLMSFRFRTYHLVGGTRTEYGDWTYHGWGAIKNPEDAVFFGGEATFEGDFAGKSYYGNAESVSRHEVTALQWQKKASGSSTWVDIPSENSRTLTITSGNDGDQFRLKGGAPGKTTVYTQAATLGVSPSGGGGGSTQVSAPQNFVADLPDDSPSGTVSMSRQNAASASWIGLQITLPSNVSFEIDFTADTEDSSGNTATGKTTSLSGSTSSSSFPISSSSGSSSLDIEQEFYHTTASGFYYNYFTESTGSPQITNGTVTARYSPNDGQNFDLSWDAPATGASLVTNYTIQYKASGDTYWSTLATTPNAVTSYTATDAVFVEGRTYSFRIRANTASSTSDWTEDTSTYTSQKATHETSLTGLTTYET